MSPATDTKQRPAANNPQAEISVLLQSLQTSIGGLSSEDAAQRLSSFGRNEIAHVAAVSWWRKLVEQLVHPLALLLWLAALISLATGSQTLGLAIIAVILLNAIFAILQESRAEHATEALRSLLPARARVLRSGQRIEVDSAELVTGDVIHISEGDLLSADARLTIGELGLDMSPLTGESQPVTRLASPLPTDVPPLEASTLVFAGTLCTTGEARAVVVATGLGTQIGRIAVLSQQVKVELSPLQKQVNKAARLIALISLAIGVVFFAVGFLVAGLTIGESGNFAIGLLVANVPEGLLPTITLALAVGVRRMAGRRALVKKLTAVETLGSTDVICTDKTGTLTEGKMTATSLWQNGKKLKLGGNQPEASDSVRALLETASYCNNARLQRDENGLWQRAGDPSESALLLAAAGCEVDAVSIQAERDKRLHLFGFNSSVKRMSTLDPAAAGTSSRVHSKGAPLELLRFCTRERQSDGSELPLDEIARNKITAAFNEYAEAGLRVFGFASRDVVGAEPATRQEADSDLCFLGLVAMRDPLRSQVAEAVSDCHRAGIRIIVITGDDGLTASAIAKQAGIVDGAPQVITGATIDSVTHDQLRDLLRRSPQLIVARSSPETKLKVVEALREDGHTVAMTGDGVNDAPALRRADIGIAMGRSGTDVAREAADIVLTDDNFASIVKAVKEGRVVYENIRKFVTYIFAHSTPEMVPFLIFALAGGAVPLPLTALLILAIDLGTETLPALALGREPAEPGLMSRPPRPRSHGILTKQMMTRAWLWIGLLEAALVVGGFFYVLLQAGWSPGDDVGKGSPLHDFYLQATTMTFAGITACQVGTAIACRTNRASLREVGFFTNPLLLAGIAFELVFAAVLIYFPPAQATFETASLGLNEVLILSTFPIIVWGSDELRRKWLRSHSPTATPLHSH